MEIWSESSYQAYLDENEAKFKEAAERAGREDHPVIVHQPVLLKEVLEFLVPPADGGLFVDATLGEGGHSAAFLERYPAAVRDRRGRRSCDPRRPRARGFGRSRNAIRFVNAWFAGFFEDYAGEREPGPRPHGPRHLPVPLRGGRRAASPSTGTSPWTCGLSPDLPGTAADIVNTVGCRRARRHPLHVRRRALRAPHRRRGSSGSARESRSPARRAWPPSSRRRFPASTATGGSTRPPAPSRPCGSP